MPTGRIHLGDYNPRAEIDPRFKAVLSLSLCNLSPDIPLNTESKLKIPTRIASSVDMGKDGSVRGTDSSQRKGKWANQG